VFLDREYEEVLDGTGWENVLKFSNFWLTMKTTAMKKCKKQQMFFLGKNAFMAFCFCLKFVQCHPFALSTGMVRLVIEGKKKIFF